MYLPYDNIFQFQFQFLVVHNISVRSILRVSRIKEQSKKKKAQQKGNYDLYDSNNFVHIPKLIQYVHT